MQREGRADDGRPSAYPCRCRQREDHRAHQPRGQPAQVRTRVRLRRGARKRHRGGFGRVGGRPFARGGAPCRIRARGAVAHHRHHLYEQGGRRAQEPPGQYARPGSGRHLGAHLPQRLRAHPAPRRGQARLPAQLHHLRHVRPALGDEGRAARARPGRQGLPAAQHARRHRQGARRAALARGLLLAATARARTPGSASSARSTSSTRRACSRPGPWTSTNLLYNTVRLFKEHPDVLEHYQRQFKYVLIDEYQGHEQPPVHARQPARWRPRQHLRGGRRRPEHIQVPRRDH